MNGNALDWVVNIDLTVYIWCISHVLLYKTINACAPHPHAHIAQLAGAVEHTDCTSAEGKTSLQLVS